MTEIKAFIYGQEIGTLIHHDNKIYFEYSDDFKSSGLEISPIKLHTSKTTKAHINQDNMYLYKGIAGVFFDSLPDKHGMSFINRYFERQNLKSTEVTLLHKLAFIGNRGMGAIEYQPKEHEDTRYEDIESVLNAKEAYEEMKKNIKDKESSIESLMSILDSVSPVGGGRPKMLVLYNKETNSYKLNEQVLVPGYKRIIIKFDEAYYQDESIGFTKLEYVFMQMAKDAGINTANFSLIEENGMHHFLLDRFDRDEKDNKIHMCTASGLMHIDISVAQGASYENLFTLTQMLCKSQEDIIELYKRMIFNVLVSNFDDHTKNFTYLMDKKGKWSISPAYDITYSKGMATQHLTTIGGKSKDFNISDLLRIAKTQSIKESRALEIIKRSIEVVKTFETRAHEINLDEDTIKTCIHDIESQIVNII